MRFPHVQTQCASLGSYLDITSMWQTTTTKWMIRRQAYRVFGQLIEGEKNSYLRTVVVGLIMSKYVEAQQTQMVTTSYRSSSGRAQHPLLPTTTLPKGPRIPIGTITDEDLKSSRKITFCQYVFLYPMQSARFPSCYFAQFPCCLPTWRRFPPML